MTLRLATVAILVALLAPVTRADGSPAGFWKLRYPDGSEAITLLLSFTQTDGKWVGEYHGSSVELKHEPQFTSLAVNGENLKFSLIFDSREFINFDGVAAKDGKKISGTYTRFGGPIRLIDLHPSKLKKLNDSFDLAWDNLTQLEGADLFDAGMTIAQRASEKKVPVEEIRGLADRLAKAATAYGPRWERAVAVRLATVLIDQPGFIDVALAQARRAERLLTENDPPAVALDVIETLARALTVAGKEDEAAKYRAVAERLETRDFAEYSKIGGFEPLPFKGRTGNSTRAALVEVFTGAECPPCIAVDLAADALVAAYKSTDVIMLQYHFHVPQPDPLTNSDGMERVDYYQKIIDGAPTVIINGQRGPEGGGPASTSKEKYEELVAAVNPQLEKPAAVKLSLAVSKAENGYTGKATVEGLEDTEGKVHLRFVLVEERVRYSGGNGARYHHHVVRAMPGGAKGFPLSQKTSEQTVTFDPAAIRGKLTEYLDEYAKKESPFPRTDRPLALKHLKLVALVQDDATNEVLQVVQADVK